MSSPEDNPAMPEKPEVVFVKYGGFSHVNGKMVEMLQKAFPSHRLRIVDAAQDILKSFPVASFRLRLKWASRRFAALIRNRNSPWDFVFSDPAAWRLISRWIAENVSPEKTAFIFQTQSIFDASHPEIPFFIYTDHTRRAHRRHPGGGSPAPVSPEWERMEAGLYAKAATVFTLSRFCARSLIEDYGVPESRVLAVSTGINIRLPDFPKDEGKTRDPVILFVGAEWGVKGGPEMLRAFRRVRQELPEARLWAVGARPPENDPGMTVYGKLPLPELDLLFRQAAVVCVPSRVERASMLALDAAAHGLPVITTPHGAGAERVRDGITGLLADPADTESFAAAMITLLRDPQRSRAMGRAGRKMVEEEFTWDAVGGNIAGRIRSLVPGI